jgi:SAM-dependent methyltransferase
MFFADRVHIISGESVLEVGPGATPHPGSQVFLEKRFSEYESFRQRGGLPAMELNRPVIYYDGGRFPFRDHEFDYVICSHVIEHVDDIEMFLHELVRVASRGYVEFPTIYYEYLYNFAEHLNFVAYKEGELLWMPKKETSLHEFEPMQRFLVRTLESGYDETIRAMKEIFFHGFEWRSGINARRVCEIKELVPSVDAIPVRMIPSPPRSMLDRARNLWARLRR